MLKEEVSEAPEKVVASLTAMGFDKPTCEIAVLQHGMNMYEAIDWMSSGCPEMPNMAGGVEWPLAPGLGEPNLEASLPEKIKQVCLITLLCI